MDKVLPNKQTNKHENLLQPKENDNTRLDIACWRWRELNQFFQTQNLGNSDKNGQQQAFH